MTLHSAPMDPNLSQIIKLAVLAVGGQGGGVNPLLYQQIVQPQLQQQQQQIEQLRQGKQIRGLGNQVQQIQRSTSMQQVGEMIRPTGHASTYQNLSHFYPQR